MHFSTRRGDADDREKWAIWPVRKARTDGVSLTAVPISRWEKRFVHARGNVDNRSVRTHTPVRIAPPNADVVQSTHEHIDDACVCR